MGRIRTRTALVCSFLFVAITHAQEQRPIEFNLYENETTFSGVGQERPLPDMRLFRDPANNRIGLACMRRTPISELRKLGVQDLDKRLEALTKGNAIILRGGNCLLSFPLIVGKQREQLQNFVQPVAAKLAPQVAQMASRIRAAVPDNPEMVFHLLWSRVMDDVCNKAWKANFSEPGPPDSTWIVYPEQRFAVGTNYNSVPGNGSSALTWSPNFRGHIRPATDALTDAYSLAWGKEIAADDVAHLQELGFVDPSHKLKVFVFHKGDHTDKVLSELTAEYGAALTGAYDYAATGKMFDIPPDEMFLVLLHETAYAVFDDLGQSRSVQIPKVLTGSGEMRDVVQLVSLAIADPPAADDDAMYMLIKNGWRGSAVTAAKFREVVDKDPNRSADWLYLGMSLYEIKDYRAAVDAFQKCAEHAAKDATLREWAVVWEAQMHDLLGERENAVRLLPYRRRVEEHGYHDVRPVSDRPDHRPRMGASAYRIALHPPLGGENAAMRSMAEEVFFNARRASTCPPLFVRGH